MSAGLLLLVLASSPGEALYQRLQCVSCHPVGKVSPAAPSLEGRFGTLSTLRSGEQVRFDEAYVRESVLTPAAKVVKGYQPIMPAYAGRLTAEELLALVDYLRSLSPGAAKETQPD